ncbi:tyrosinase family protein [Pseudomonas anatoliensis]|uniref:tyrosinase family protein n=1 Tax=Pseudomonas anatoliensis TaxID=2710589 RepID=UPI001B319AD0|nr:tyrosinase family protein [Pseudomonas anatoliensis]MBP5959061.1 tyrosinase family protein [Pseudomonas anatoliensis]
MDIRRNHRDMSAAQKAAFIRAILILKNHTPSILRPGEQCRYDDFVQIHKNSMGLGNPITPNPHRNPLFFPWHRILIRQFEWELQVVADDPGITLPYWNWSMSGADNPFNDDFMGRDGDPQSNQRVTLGPFAFKGRAFDVRVWNGDEGAPELRRDFGADGSPLPDAQEIESVMMRTPYWSEPEGWENTIEQMHNNVHSWVGGNMGTATSPNDPIFFLHHCHLDYLWERWKRQHPAEPAIAFADDASQDMLDVTLIFHPDIEPAPWQRTWKVGQVLDTEALDYRYDLSDGAAIRRPESDR